MSISLDSLFSRVANNYGVDNLKPDSYGKQNSATYNDNFIDLRNNNEEDKTYDDFVEAYIEAAMNLGYTKEEAIKELESNDITVDSSYSTKSNGNNTETEKKQTNTSSIMKTVSVDKSTLPKEIQEMIEDIEGQIDENDQKINELEDQIENLSKEAQEAIEEAIKNQEKIQDEYDEDSQKALSKAMEEYISANKEDPGSMDKTDLQQLIKDGMPNKPDLAEVTASLAAASDIVSEIDDCLSDLNKLTQDSKSLENQINQLTTKQVTDCDKVASILEEEKGVTISDEEWNLAETNNVNLSEKMEDGSARYIFAQGKSDNQYHIYDMAQGGASLARLYGDNQGFCIVESGNGYINNYTENENGTNTVYSINECGEINETKACYSTCSPLSFDLNGDGVKTSNNIIDYDIDGDGQKDKINDSADAVLVFDKDNDGISGTDGSECFGNNTDLDGDGKADGFKDGFEALKAMATEAGLINGKDDNILDENDLAILEKDYGLKMKTNGYNSESQSLSELGITEINLSETDTTTLIDNFDGNGNQLMKQNGATFKINGETREYADIWHKKQDEDFANDEQENIYSTRTESYESFYNLYKSDSENLRNKIEETKNRYNNFSKINKRIKEEGNNEATNFFENLKLKKEYEKYAS